MDTNSEKKNNESMYKNEARGLRATTFGFCEV
jgi:hypothetical protein